MKKYILLLMATITLGLAGCSSSNNSKNTIDWQGIYTGPCCPDVVKEFQLNNDNTYILTQIKTVDATKIKSVETGEFVWHKSGNFITLYEVEGKTQILYVQESALYAVKEYKKPQDLSSVRKFTLIE